MFSTDFENCEWCAAFINSCASDKRNNEIQNKLIKKYYKIKFFIFFAFLSSFFVISIFLWFMGNFCRPFSFLFLSAYLYLLYFSLSFPLSFLLFCINISFSLNQISWKCLSKKRLFVRTVLFVPTCSRGCVS